MLSVFTEPSSPKIRDLREDGSYAMHCSVGEEGLLSELLISGEAVVISDPKKRAHAERIAASPVVLMSYVLFEFHVDRVLVVEYDEERKPVVRRWTRSDAN